MKKVTIFSVISTLVFTLTCVNALADSLMPLDVGWVFNYVRTACNGTSWDNCTGTSWINTFTVTGTKEIDEKQYFELDRYNYRNENETVKYYFYSTDTQIWQSSNGINGYVLFDINANISDQWMSDFDTYARYNGEYIATTNYFTNIHTHEIEQTKNVFEGGPDDGKPNFSDNSRNWYELIAPSIGVLLEVDNWTDNAPKINELVSITKPSAVPVPEPSTTLLIGIGLAGLAAISRKKT